MPIAVSLFHALLAAAWLVPNHYAPWSSAWGDALAIAGLLLLLPTAAVGAVSGGRVTWRLSGIAVLCCAVILVQLATGKLLFSGDAWMAILYIGLWWAAVLAGGLMATRVIPRDGVNILAVAWLFAAVLSVGLALVQWTGALSLGIYGVDLPPGGRPFGNVAQANHLCTLCFLGLCSVLWLHQRQQVNGMAFGLAVGFLLLGMVMTQSRTGWLQIGLLVVWAIAMRTRAGLRISRAQLTMLGALFAVGVLLWPAICEALLLSAGRSMGDQMQAGVRLPYWLSMLDAIGREPLWGYGWQQVGAAQQRVALDHPAVGSMFEHSHNLVLDLLLWSGIPIGVLVIAALAWWFIAHIRACHDARVVWMLAAVSGVFVHGMLEFPLEYAYFLIPVGFAMGAIDTYSPAGGRSLHVSRWTALAVTALLGAVFVGTATEYLKAEENYRTLRMESARIGVDRVVTPAPELRLLTQLEALLQFARTEATTGMRPEQLGWMHRVSQRFGYPPVLFRYALAAGLNDQPDVARETLARICRIHELQRCLEAKEGWATLQAQYPALAGIAVADKP
ncbi:PglL family O-oligosaccharyltransferase [Polaromonas sp. AET17H-212]|uniref:PglL family O-oligosaccharyltransferase n=1 Tax=Polaromonas sp. AET17H-212 TaxID=1977061 RepID=UPI001596EBD2|nr:O-antigen ligase family protein [Polaromonas sp. AET17H-212]